MRLDRHARLIGSRYNAILTSLLSLGFLAACSSSDQTQTRAEANNPASSARPSDQIVQLLEQTPGQASISYDGVVEAEKDAKVAAQVSGTVTQLNVTAGDQVTRGQVLLQLDQRSADAQWQATQAQIAGAQAQLALARSELNRQQMLYQQQYVSQAALERAQANYKAVLAEHNALLSQSHVAKTTQQDYTIRAPFSGVVSQVNVVQGDMALSGQPLVMLYDPNHLRVSLSLPQQVASSVQLDQPQQLQVQITALNRPVQVRSAKLLPATDAMAQSRTLRLDLLTTDNQISTGMTAKVTLPVQHSAGQTGNPALASTTTNNSKAIMLPIESVVRRGDLVGVYVLNPQGQPQLRQVRLGQQVGEQVEVLAGLNPQDQVLRQAQVATQQTGLAQSKP